MPIYVFQVALPFSEGDTVLTGSRRRGVDEEKHVLFVAFSVDEDTGEPKGVDAEVLLASAFNERTSQSRSVPLHLGIVLERRVKALLLKNSKNKLQDAVKTLLEASERLPNTASAGGLREKEKRASADRLKKVQAEEEQAAATIQHAISEDLMKALRLYHERFPRWHLGDLAEGPAGSPGSDGRKFPLLVEAERALKEDAAAAAAVEAAKGVELDHPEPTSSNVGFAGDYDTTIPISPRTLGIRASSASTTTNTWAEKYGVNSPSRRGTAENAETTMFSDSGLRSPPSPSPSPALLSKIKGAVSRELLHARRYREGYREYLASSNSFEQKKLRLALVVSALEHSDYHTAESVAGNEYNFGPFYSEKIKTL
jgi:hypothetical protein